MAAPSPERTRPWSGEGTFLALFALALALRLANSAYGSLKLDDFHSLHHARASDLAAFFRVLTQDNHPPLSFLLVRGARTLFGEEPWALRLPALLAGLATLALVWRIGARLACTRARTAATALVAVSSLHLELSSDLRMYALLALAGAGLLEALLSALEEGRGTWRIGLWTVIGLHSHYHFLYTLAVLGSATLFLGTRPPYRARLRACLGAFAAAGLLSAPWYLLGFPAQLAHGLAPGGSNATLLRLFEGFKNLEFPNVSVAGPALRLVLLAASALFLGLAGLGALGTLRAARGTGRVALPVLLVGAALVVPLLGWSAVHLSRRTGFEWRYLAGALPAFCLLAAAEACAVGFLARTRRLTLAGVIASALVLAVFNARDPGEEDYRGAAEWVLARATPADALVAADWQPRLFPHALGWRYYAAHRPPASRPESLEHTDDFALLAPERLAGHERVFCFLRSLPRDCALLQTLRSRYPREEVHAFGRSIHVHVFTRP